MSNTITAQDMMNNPKWVQLISEIDEHANCGSSACLLDASENHLDFFTAFAGILQNLGLTVESLNPTLLDELCDEDDNCYDCPLRAFLNEMFDYIAPATRLLYLSPTSNFDSDIFATREEVLDALIFYSLKFVSPYAIKEMGIEQHVIESAAAKAESELKEGIDQLLHAYSHAQEIIKDDYSMLLQHGEEIDDLLLFYTIKGPMWYHLSYFEKRSILNQEAILSTLGDKQ